MLILKNLAHILAAPLALGALIAVVSVMFRWQGRRKTATGLLIAAGAVTYFASTAWVGDRLLGPLEQQYPSIADGRSPPPASWIVVLGSGYEPRVGISVTAALDHDGLVRIVEAVRLEHEYPGMRLLVSGGARPGFTPPAQGYADLARSLGIDPASILISDKALDTASEAGEVAKVVGTKPFLLVTSAYHMPRAMHLMQKAGVRPIPAPTGQLVDRTARTGWDFLVPGSAGLSKTERALHEYLGLLAASLGFD